MRHEKILEIDNYCEKVADICKNKFHISISPLQIEESISAIAALYTERLFDEGASDLNIVIDASFSSKYVNMDEIQEEIKYSTGIKDPRTRKIIHRVMGSSLYNILSKSELTYFKPLGTFKFLSSRGRQIPQFELIPSRERFTLHYDN